MSEFASQNGRKPYLPDGRVVCRREPLSHNGVAYKVGEDVDTDGLTQRNIAVLWDQGWIDTLPRNDRGDRRARR